MTTQRVLDRLIADGHLDETGVTRTPRPVHCRACRLGVIAAITDAGFTVACWPTPTTALGELHAAAAGLPTYSWHPGDGLYRRDDFRIAAGTTGRVRVLVTHRCGDPPPPANPAWAVRERARQAHEDPTAPPPY